MSTVLRPVVPALVAAGVLAAWSARVGAGQPPARSVPGPAPRLASGRPDLNGVWMPPYVPDMTRNGRGQRGYAEPPFSPDDTPLARQRLYQAGHRAELPFTPWGLKQWVSYDAANGDYTGSCLPFGLTRSINAPNPFQIVQSEATVALLYEVNTWFHVVPIGATRPRELEPTWFGHSVGRWEGDTLVVDTIGFNGYTRLDTVGHPHSDALHVIQTFRRTDAEHIAYTVTIDDPKTYTKPWTNERVFTLMKGPLIEYSCEENNKDLREGHIRAWTPPWVQKPHND